MKFIDLFSGVGGFHLGIKKAMPDAECVWANDFDKYAMSVYNKQFGTNYKATDIKQVDAKDIPDHDLLCGGFPCPSWSIAGKRKGFEDERGELFWDIIRIVKEKQPKYLLLENVKGLLSHDKGKSFETICEAICEAGYIVDFTILNSKYFGVPQNRERVFIMAIRSDLIEKNKII